jgi:hypothetical protein
MNVRNIDILMTKLRSLVEETNCALLLVAICAVLVQIVGMRKARKYL